MGHLEWSALLASDNPKKSSPKLIVSYPLRTQNENEILKKMRLSTCNETIQPPEKWHNVSIGGRVCQGPRCPRIHNHD